MDIHDLKERLIDYLGNTGHELNTRKNPPVMRCPSPSHDDSNPSAVVYPDKVWCPVCNKNWDIFDIAGFVEGTQDFKEQKKAVAEALGATITDLASERKKRKPTSKAKKKKEEKCVRLSIDKAREIYSPDAVVGLYSTGGSYAKMWPYRDESGDVVCVDVRFEDGKKKQVITFWYDGQSLRFRNAPDMLYGLYDLSHHPDKPVLVVEGCKTAAAAEAMEQFVVVTWRGGTNRADKHDWSPLLGRKVFILPDDDKPGVRAAVDIQKMIPDSRIVEPYPPARQLKEKGADCVEYLEMLTPDELADYIFKSEKRSEGTEGPHQEKLPFRIMGRASENDTFFIDRDGWLVGAAHGAYNKQFCLRLAPLAWWKFDSGFANEKTRSVYWDDVMCWLIGASNKDFDPGTVRGRGAWKNKDGAICFNDGRRIWGSVDPLCHYLKKQTLDIDLDHPPATAKQRLAVWEATAKLRFETAMDAVRTIAWSTLAPFGGCIPWRSAALLTGSSGSGKTTIIDYIIRPIAKPLTVSGGESTEAGVRQAIGSDSRAVVIEEAEKDTHKKAGRRDDLFSLMRQSTSDDAPIVAKGTQDGKGMSFQLRSMFLFAAISPEVAQIADDNRIFKLNLRSARRTGETNWGTLKAELRNAINPEVCAGIRSFTWQNIRRIVLLAEKISSYLQEITGRGTRYALAEALFLSCYYVVYWDKQDDSVDDIKGEIESLIDLAPKEETRDDALEMLQRILDENIFISSEKGTRTIGELSRILGEGRQYDEEGGYQSILPNDTKDYRAAIGRHGVTVTIEGDLCIAKHHHRISEITGASRGYHLTLKRLEVPTEEKVCKFAGESKRALVIAGYYDVKNQMNSEY